MGAKEEKFKTRWIDNSLKTKAETLVFGSVIGAKWERESDRVTFSNLHSLLNLDPKKPDAILDIGCGPLARAEVQLANSYPMVGLDLSKASIQRAIVQTKLFKLHKKVSFVVADAEHLPFKPNAFKIILCIGTICHLPNFNVLRNTLNEMKRVTKQEGLLYLPWWINALSLVALERKLLTKIMDVFGIPHNQYLKFKGISEIKQIISNEKLKITSIFYSELFEFPWLFYSFPQKIQKYQLKIMHILNYNLSRKLWVSKIASHFAVICQKTDKHLQCSLISFSENLP